MSQFGSIRKLFARCKYVAAATAATVTLFTSTCAYTAVAGGVVESAMRDVRTDTEFAAHVVYTTQLPTDKLSCKIRCSHPQTPVVLVSCGSFNPPTVMHMRMVDLAGNELMRRGYDVWGAYLSPVADAYGKQGLAPAVDRVAMCRLAAEDEPANSGSSRGVGNSVAGPHLHATSRHMYPAMNLIMVYDWEANQAGYTRTLAVLRRVESELRDWASGTQGGTLPERLNVTSDEPGAQGSTEVQEAGSGSGFVGMDLRSTSSHAASIRADAPSATVQQPFQARDPPVQRFNLQPQPVRAMLLCGADVLASMAVPGVWRDPDVILREHGVVCVAREGTDLEQLLNRPGSLLHDYRDRIVVVYDRVGNSISSSKVREELAAGRPVRYLVPQRVLSYIYDKGLYGTSQSNGA